MNNTKFTQSCLPRSRNSVWTRALLHDSELKSSTNKMDNYISTLLFDTADDYGYDFGQKSNDENMIENMDHKNLYSSQNFITLDKKERLYEKSTEIDKLLAKFDANIEDIWKSSTESDNLRNIKYHTWFSQNFSNNPYIQYESNLIWSFEQEANREKNLDLKLNKNCCDSSFSHWNTLSYPILQNSYSCFDTVLNAFNATISNIQKWSTIEECNTLSDSTNKKLNGFSAVIIPTEEAKDTQLKNSQEQALSEKISNCNEEEDLLISTKTHFRPIRAEEMGSSQVNTYADGTTFPISNDLEEVSFKRSESGLLYLEVDAETPKKYMEFKEKEGNGNKEWNYDGAPVEEFIPKFRLRQSNEKCIQTEEIEDEQIVPVAHDSDCESLSCKSDEDEFYFPGDNEMAQYIINTSEEEMLEEENVIKKDNFLNKKIDILDASLCHVNEWKHCACGGEKDWYQNSINFPNEVEWNQIWKMKKTCNSCRSNSDSEKLSLKDWYRFREELTQDGEQLLLDLSCMQQIYSNSNWCDDDSDVTHDFNNENPPIIEEEIIGASEIGYPEKATWWSTLIAKEEYIKNGLDFRCLWNEDQFIPDFLRNEKKSRIGKETERKRRNSSNQRACSFHPEGQCRRPYYRFAHFDLTMGCFKNESCSLFRGARRPLSL